MILVTGATEFSEVIVLELLKHWQNSTLQKKKISNLQEVRKSFHFIETLMNILIR